MENIDLIELEQTHSTNSYLKDLSNLKSLNEGVVVRTKNQTNGKGQGSNTWESESGKNLTISLLLQPTFLPAEKMFLISKIVSIGIVETLNQLGKNFKIKWPNDIYYKDKKVAGILIENQLSGCCLKQSIIGMGLNVNQKSFISDAPNPASLAQVFSKTFDLNTILNSIIENIKLWYIDLKNEKYDKINQTYFSHLYRKEGYHGFKTKDDAFQAKIEKINEDGKMILKTNEEILHEFYFKEVEFII